MAARLTLRTASDDGKVVIEVADTGSGLTREECERIFTPYYTSKQHGTGLGLAIVQSVISDHGGRIGVHSETGRGTTFTIELPDNLQLMRTAIRSIGRWSAVRNQEEHCRRKRIC